MSLTQIAWPGLRFDGPAGGRRIVTVTQREGKIRRGMGTSMTIECAQNEFRFKLPMTDGAGCRRNHVPGPGLDSRRIV